MLAVFTWTNRKKTKKKQKKTTKKQNMVMKTYKEFLGTCIKSKKTAYINKLCTKPASKDYSNCFTIFGSSACQGQHAFSRSVLTCTAPSSSHTNVQELIQTLKCQKKSKKVKNKLKIKPL